MTLSCKIEAIRPRQSGQTARYSQRYGGDSDANYYEYVRDRTTTAVMAETHTQPDKHKRCLLVIATCAINHHHHLDWVVCTVGYEISHTNTRWLATCEDPVAEAGPEWNAVITAVGVSPLTDFYCPVIRIEKSAYLRFCLLQLFITISGLCEVIVKCACHYCYMCSMQV